MPRRRSRRWLHPLVITGLVIAGAVVLVWVGVQGGWLKAQVAGEAGSPIPLCPSGQAALCQEATSSCQCGSIPAGVAVPSCQAGEQLVFGLANGASEWRGGCVPRVAPSPTMTMAPAPTPVVTPKVTPLPTSTPTPIPTVLKTPVVTPKPTPPPTSPPPCPKLSFFSRLLRAAVGQPGCPQATPTPVVKPTAAPAKALVPPAAQIAINQPPPVLSAQQQPPAGGKQFLPPAALPSCPVGQAVICNPVTGQCGACGPAPLHASPKSCSNGLTLYCSSVLTTSGASVCGCLQPLVSPPPNACSTTALQSLPDWRTQPLPPAGSAAPGSNPPSFLGRLWGSITGLGQYLRSQVVQLLPNGEGSPADVGACYKSDNICQNDVMRGDCNSAHPVTNYWYFEKGGHCVAPSFKVVTGFGFGRVSMSDLFESVFNTSRNEWMHTLKPTWRELVAAADGQARQACLANVTQELQSSCAGQHANVIQPAKVTAVRLNPEDQSTPQPPGAGVIWWSRSSYCSTVVSCSQSSPSPPPPGNHRLQASFTLAFSGGRKYDFTDTSVPSPGRGITFWHWNFGDGGDSYERNPRHTYAVDGVYRVTLVVSDGAGQSPEAAQNVTVPPEVSGGTGDINPPPPPDADIDHTIPGPLFANGPRRARNFFFDVLVPIYEQMFQSYQTGCYTADQIRRERNRLCVDFRADVEQAFAHQQWLAWPQIRNRQQRIAELESQLGWWLVDAFSQRRREIRRLEAEIIALQAAEREWDQLRRDIREKCSSVSGL